LAYEAYDQPDTLTLIFIIRYYIVRVANPFKFQSKCSEVLSVFKKITDAISRRSAMRPGLASIFEPTQFGVPMPSPILRRRIVDCRPNGKIILLH
jgi:hypothetical protein